MDVINNEMGFIEINDIFENELNISLDEFKVIYKFITKILVSDFFNEEEVTKHHRDYRMTSYFDKNPNASSTLNFCDYYLIPFNKELALNLYITDKFQIEQNYLYDKLFGANRTYLQFVKIENVLKNKQGILSYRKIIILYNRLKENVNLNEHI